MSNDQPTTITVGESYVVDGLGNQLVEPARLDPQRAAYLRAFYPQLMHEFPPEGRDLLLEVEHLRDIARTTEVMDHLEWLFVNDTGGYVLRGNKVHEGKQNLFATFHLPTQDQPTEGQSN